MNDVEYYGPGAESPAAGGFVCHAGSSLEWIRTVESVWVQYYCAYGVGYADSVPHGGGTRRVPRVLPVLEHGVGSSGDFAGGSGGGVRPAGIGESGTCVGGCEAGWCEASGSGREGVGCVAGESGGGVGTRSSGECVGKLGVGSGTRACDGGFTGSDEEFREDVGCGSGGGVVRGKHWKRNQRKAAKRREKVTVSSDVPEWRRKNGVKQVVGEKSKLQLSLEAKWEAENELKVLEAQRKIELLKKQDVDAIAKCNARKLQAASEKAMVQMEKAHATLVATGNVPGEVALGGTAHTVVDGEIVPDLTNSCSISPSSSISEREVREMMKALEDAKKENEELKEKMKFMKLDHKLERFGDQCAVTMTCDSEGELPEGREELLEQIVRANNGREEDRVYKKDYFKKKIVNVKVQQYRQLGMDEYVGAFDY